MRTTTRNIRLTHVVLDQIDREAERRNCGQADIIREALSKYFEGRQVEAALLGLEQRLSQRLTDGLQRILTLAEPT